MRDKKLKYGSNEIHKRKASAWDVILKAEIVIIIALVTAIIFGTITQLV